MAETKFKQLRHFIDLCKSNLSKSQYSIVDVEINDGVPPSNTNVTLASITFPNLDMGNVVINIEATPTMLGSFLWVLRNCNTLCNIHCHNTLYVKDMMLH